jgi:predicted Rossmann fold nucleotide-binding protein DprA/Smf involved in DNA uptake
VGNSTSEGANALLRDGAHVIRGAQDVLDSLLGAGVLRARVDLGSDRGPELEPGPAVALDAIEAGADGVDAIAAEAALGPGPAAAALARLELMGYVRCDSVGRVERTPLVRPGGPPPA